MKPILEVKNIGKKFNIKHSNQPYLSFRDVLSSMFSRNRDETEEMWALDDVSFKVDPGESVGIIGRNGAGKSTLLKVLSKITPPSSGEIVCRGRIASLLEVGTGFHPELSGRENIFLNGSILGMKRKEISAKFDEIVDFSGAERFLDTPLKHYSSGMSLRLAFSVAAFLEPEVLVIDEVLAVGDAEFQKKCLGKMESVASSGRTILFVSHNLAILDVLCPRSILLNQGQLAMDGPTAEAIDLYLNKYTAHGSGFSNGEIDFKSENAEFQIRKVKLYNNDSPANSVYMGSSIRLDFHFESDEFLKQPGLGLVFRNSRGINVLGINHKNYAGVLADKPWKNGIISVSIPYNQLIYGVYNIDVYFGDTTKGLKMYGDLFQLTVESRDFSGTGILPKENINNFFMKDISFVIHE